MKAKALFAFAAVILLSIPFALSAASASSPSSQARTPIRHVIIVTMENHSFDNLFGAYPYGGTSPASSTIGNLTVPDNLYTSLNKGNLTPVPQGTFRTANPVEGYTAYHLDWNNGRMNGFRANSGAQSMTYFTASQMGPEWVLAQQFALGDMYFSSTLSATMPNRLYGIAGYSPVINDYGLPPYIPFSQSIFAELNAHGVSWSYYVAHPSDGLDVLAYFHGIGAQTSNVKGWNTFEAQLSSNTLPAVSYFSPIGVGVSGYSQHPPDSVLAGELWLYRLVSDVMHSPEWNSTALFINYDEGGGYYDHVPPPVTGGQQLGFRVPFILISPYAKEDYISGTVMNHASLLAFIDYNWNMPALNRLVSYSNIPLDMFYGLNGSFPPRQPVPLPSTPYFTTPSTFYFQTSGLSNQSLSQLFPAVPQTPYSQLPYARNGSSAFNLSTAGTGLFVHSNTPYTPVYESDAVLAAALGVMLLAGYLILPGRKEG